MPTEVAAHEQIVARKAAHRAPVYYAVFPFGVIAQVGCGQVLYCVQRAGMQRGLAVRLLHAYVERGYDFSAHIVLARNVYAAQQAFVVDSKTRYLFHTIIFYLFNPNRSLDRILFYLLCFFMLPSVFLLPVIAFQGASHLPARKRPCLHGLCALLSECRRTCCNQPSQPCKAIPNHQYGCSNPSIPRKG